MYTGFSSAQHSGSPNRMHQTARDGIMSQRRKKRGQTVEAVSVHVMKLEDLPEPLTRREFREICQREGIPISAGGNGARRPTNGDFFDQCRDSQQLRIQERWNNTVSNLFGAYLKIFDLFKSWHSSMIQQRHFGPSNVEEHVASQMPRPPFKTPIKPNLTKTEEQHVIKQKMLVNLLIQYGIGLAMNEAIQQKTPGFDQLKHHSGQQTLRYPTPMGSHQYGPMINNQMIFETIGSNGAITGKSMQTNLQLPTPGTNLKAQVRRQSPAVSDQDSRNLNSYLDSSNTKQHGNLESFELGAERNMDDYEHFDVQDEVQIAQNAEARLRLITTQPDAMLNNSVQTAQKTVDIQKKESKSTFGFGDDLLSGQMLTEKELNNMKEFFSPMHLRLKQELLETREKLEQVTKQLESSEKRNVAVISKYNKEEVERTVLAKHLSMPYPEQADVLRSQIESKFLNVADGLEPHIVAILNTKMEQIKAYFIGQIQLISHHTESLRQNVALMENMNKDGIKFSDLDTDKLIERIYTIEELKRHQNTELRQLDPSSKYKKDMNRPQCIWNMLTRHFGQDYFLEVIEEEFGITPGANEIYASKIEHHFQHSITAYKVEQHRMQRESDDQVKMLREEILDLTEENSRLMKQNEKRSDNKMQELRKNLTAIHQNKEDAITKKYVALLQQRDETIRELNYDRDNYYRSQKSMQINWAFKRLQMFRTVSNLIKSVDEHKRTKIDYKVLKLIERFMTEEQLIRRYSDEHDVPPQVAKFEMYQNKLLKWKRKWEDSEANYGWHCNRADFLANRVEEFRCKVEGLKDENITLKFRLPQLKTQVDQFQETIRLKELTIKELTENVSAIEKRWSNQTKDPHKFTAKKILESLQVKSDNELSTFLAVSALKNSARGHKHRTIGTITEHQNVSIPFESKRMPERTETDEKDCQVGPVMENKFVETENFRRDVACGKDRDFHLKSKYVQCDDVQEKYRSHEKGLNRQSTFADLNANNQAATSSNRMHKAGKTSFTRPQMKKAQSTVLGSKEYVFQNTSRGQNISSMSKDLVRGDDAGSVQDSPSKLVRRNTLTTKPSAQKRANAGSTIEQQSKDPENSKSAKRRQTAMLGGLGRRSDNQRSDYNVSPDVDTKSKRSNLQRGKTHESITSRDAGEFKTSKSKNLIRQQLAGISSQSKNSSEGFTSNLRQNQQRIKLRDSMDILNQPSSKISPKHAADGHHSALGNHHKNNVSTSMKSPERLNASSNTKLAAKNAQKSKEKLGLSKKQRNITERLTSAVVKPSPDKQMSSGNLRNNLGKYQSKRDLKPPSMVKDSSQTSTSKLARNKQQSSMGQSRKNNQRMLTDQKDDTNRQSAVYGALATVRSNASSQRKLAVRTMQHNKLGKTSPNSYMIVTGGEELPNTMIGAPMIEDKSTDRGASREYPNVLVNSFGDLAGSQTTPLQRDGQGLVIRQEQSTGEQLKERHTDQMPTEGSAINLNLMEARFNPAGNPAADGEQNRRVFQNADRNPKPAEIIERNMALKKRHPTTVQDTSKDYSPAASRQQQPLSGCASQQYSHIPTKERLESPSDQQQEEEEQDIYSTHSVQPEGVHDVPLSQMRSSHRRAKNMSNQFDDLLGQKALVDGNMSNEGLNKRSSPNKHSTLFFGGSAVTQTIADEIYKHPGRALVSASNSSIPEGRPHQQSEVEKQQLTSRFTEVKPIKSNNQSLVEFTQNGAAQANQVARGTEKYLALSGGPLSISSTKQKSRRSKDKKSRSSSNSSKIRRHNNMSAEQQQRNVQQLSISKYKSFATDDDTSQYSSRKHGKGNPGLNQIYDMIEKQSHQNKDPALAKQSKIQKLLLKGYINEEQFICLQLLEKGYIPASPGEFLQAQHTSAKKRHNLQQDQQRDSNNSSAKRRRNQHRFASATVDNGAQSKMQHHGHTISVNTVSSGFYRRHLLAKGVYSSSNSRSPSRSRSKQRGGSKGFFEKTYRIYPKKIPELEKIFNRVYSKKREMGTQCDEETTANVLMQGAEQEELERKMLWQTQPAGRSSHPPKSSSKQAQHSRKKLSMASSQPKSGRYFVASQSRRNSKEQVHSSTQYPFSTMNSMGDKNNPLEAILAMQSHGFPMVQSHPNLINPLQKSAEVFHEKDKSARSKWVGAIPVEKTEPNQSQQVRKAQKVHKLSKNHREQIKVLQSASKQQRANMLTSCSQMSTAMQQQTMNTHSAAEMVSGYRTNQGKAANHNLIVPGGHGAFVAHAINGRQTAPPKRQINPQISTVASDLQQQKAQANHPYLAQHAPPRS